ncbi:glutamate 5-kinase [Neolewinella lacunae]|uniref:Glutamate 5-kinase n=1 Tax=Neolewinella lacunae TaxID=1517758 RepID=A0A923T8J5_9BACT|nr:glutamate 5-kinase [Neolewinella lacunae]MBC6994644.1 glutamate 5-kinase [Neolewinella lacunae]MDN3634516.1 glutamate 5-kinase [Neolewinella lacunae]
MYRSLVIKVGTNVLTRPDGRLDITNISHLVDQIAGLKAVGISLVLVSSGAVGAGREIMSFSEDTGAVAQRQVLSAIGQVRLMELYRQLFASHGLLCAQVLATKGDFRDDLHADNMLNCFRALLHDQIVPVVNENDVVAVTELMFTDNDELAGLVARMLQVDALVILSSVDGLYDGPPDAPGSQLIREVAAGDDSVLQFVQEKKTAFGRGGMATKIRIATSTASVGIPVLLGNGRKPNVLDDLRTGQWAGTTVKA